jgi:hypothetical protein
MIKNSLPLFTQNCGDFMTILLLQGLIGIEPTIPRIHLHPVLVHLKKTKYQRKKGKRPFFSINPAKLTVIL